MGRLLDPPDTLLIKAIALDAASGGTSKEHHIMMPAAIYLSCLFQLVG